MFIHHAIKNRRVEADRIIAKTAPSSEFFLIKPLDGQVKLSRKLFLEAEERLHKTAYPHLYQKLSDQQRKQLIELSKNLTGLWEDDDYCSEGQKNAV
ncbi:MAG: hypothetical protein ACOYXT_02430 [Bacteroidota bacterium]